MTRGIFPILWVFAALSEIVMVTLRVQVSRTRSVSGPRLIGGVMTRRRSPFLVLFFVTVILPVVLVGLVLLGLLKLIRTWVGGQLNVFPGV